MKLIKPDDLEREAKYLRLMVYGAPGVGKTWFMASAALDERTAPVLFVEYRSQIQSLNANPAYIEAIKDGRLRVVRLSNYDELSNVCSWMRDPKACPELAGLFAGNEGRARTVCIDSVTELQRMEVMRWAGNPTDKFLRELKYPAPRDWGNLLNQFSLLARMFYDTDIPMHVVFGALEQSDWNDKGTQVKGFKVAMQGQGQDIFPSYALTLMRLARAPANVEAHNAGVTSTARASSKEQTGKIPKTILSPTIPKLVRLLEGGDQRQEA